MRQYIAPHGMLLSEAIGNALIIAREHTACVLIANGMSVIVQRNDSPAAVLSLWRRLRTIHQAYRELSEVDSECAGR